MTESEAAGVRHIGEVANISEAVRDQPEINGNDPRETKSMASDDWEETKAEFTRLAVATYRAARRETSAFVADHPEIKETADRAKREALKELRSVLRRWREH